MVDVADVTTPAAAGLRYPVEPDEKYKASVMFIAKGGKSAGQCSLYFPEAVNFSDGLVYDNANLGVAGEIARLATSGDEGRNKLINQSKSAGTAVAAQAANLRNMKLNDTDKFEQFGDNLSGVGDLFSLGVQGFTEDIAPAIASGVAAGTERSANPHKRSVFRDVAVRTFSFSFLMSPQSSAESSSIENIVNFFRENAYPERILDGLGYKFPTKFTIEFLYRGVKMTQAPKLLPCYLTSVNTVINPRSASFFADGKANEVQLSMSFQEETALHAAKIRDGY